MIGAVFKKGVAHLQHFKTNSEYGCKGSFWAEKEICVETGRRLRGRRKGDAWRFFGEDDLESQISIVPVTIERRWDYPISLRDVWFRYVPSNRKGLGGGYTGRRKPLVLFAQMKIAGLYAKPL
jgi:hypothetical protein